MNYFRKPITHFVKQKMKEETPNFARKFVGTLISGGVTTYGMQKYSENQERRQIPQYKSTHIEQLDKKLSKGLDEDPISSSTQSTFSGFNPMTWEFPRPTDKVKLVTQYARKTNNDQLKEDGQDIAINIAKREAKKVIYAPKEAIKKVRKFNDIHSGIKDNDGDKILGTINDLKKQTAIKSIHSIGLNQMFKASSYLLPPIIGAPVRMYFNAKAIGNVGREVNKAGKTLENIEGPTYDVMKKRTGHKLD